MLYIGNLFTSLFNGLSGYFNDTFKLKLLLLFTSVVTKGGLVYLFCGTQCLLSG